MTKIKFSSPKHSIIVAIDDGSYACSGSYEGASIKSVLPMDDGAYCVLLLDPDANEAQAFENLICINRAGRHLACSFADKP